MLQRALANVAAVVAIMAVAVVAVAADAPTPLRSLCTDDGTISREALSVQVTGCISLSECQVVLDPIEGPRISIDGSNDIEFETTKPARIRAAAIYDGRLILAGEFDPVAGTRSRNIVAWDGDSYVSIGRFGNNDAILDLAIYNGELIVAGEFTQAGNELIAYVAVWDGQYFSALGDGLDRAAAGLEVDEGRLYVAGDVQMGIRYGANNLVTWDGKHFQSASMDELAYIMDRKKWSSAAKLTAATE